MPPRTGHPRWGGRQKGTPNKVNLVTRQQIELEADPLGFLSRIVNGEEIDGERPSLDQRIAAARYLGDKLVPDLKAVEMDAQPRHEPEAKMLEDLTVEKMLEDLTVEELKILLAETKELAGFLRREEEAGDEVTEKSLYGESKS